MKCQSFRQSVAAVLAVMCLFLLAAPVRAEGDSTSADVMIPVTVKDTSGMLTDSTSFRVTLVGKDAAAPLPAVTEYILTAAPEATCEFGPLAFDEPGNYRYLIRQEQLTGDDTVITDHTVYAVTVVVITDDDVLSATVEVRKQNENQKRAALVFENSDKRAQKDQPNTENDDQSSEDDDDENAHDDIRSLTGLKNFSRPVRANRFPLRRWDC